MRKRLLDGDICGRALCSAARFGQINVVNLLLKHGSDVHYHNDAPLFLAVDGEHLAIIKVLLRGGATSTVSAVCWATRRGNHRCLALLMSGASWHYHELRHILCHVGAAGVNIVECARIVLRYCADAYLDQCIVNGTNPCVTLNLQSESSNLWLFENCAFGADRNEPAQISESLVQPRRLIASSPSGRKVTKCRSTTETSSPSNSAIFTIVAPRCAR